MNTTHYRSSLYATWTTLCGRPLQPQVDTSDQAADVDCPSCRTLLTR